ncbi:hypothetical protein QLX08_003430 [Tetragonisca angustula]|uniref:Uncharacterized protein n=1 Tax=Tetragonisca angustula TaxID=166442 RepID=A0AAW1A6J8_9HYME
MKLTICNGEKRPNLSHGICKRASRYRRRLRRNILSRIDPVTHIRIVSRGKRWRKGVELAIKGKTAAGWWNPNLESQFFRNCTNVVRGEWTTRARMLHAASLRWMHFWEIMHIRGNIAQRGSHST